MNRAVEVVSHDADVRSAASKMRDLNIAVIPVCDGALLAGILTERDITVRLAAEGRDATRTYVGEIMTRDHPYCFEDQTIDEAAARMSDQRIDRLPILDRNRRLVGVVVLSDLRSHITSRAAALAEIASGANPATPAPKGSVAHEAHAATA